LPSLQRGSEKNLEKKLTSLTMVKIANKKAEALRKRLIRHRNELFTFLSHPEVEPTNNFSDKSNYAPVSSQGNFPLGIRQRREQTGMQ